MRHIIVEGLPAAGKSEILELLARFHPESLRVLPEMVKEVVLRDGIDLFNERDRLTEALLAEIPRRRAAVNAILESGKICIEESHLGVHYAYAQALGDRGFVSAFDRLHDSSPTPDAYARLNIPVDISVVRQAARGTHRFDIEPATLERFLVELDAWHANAGTTVRHISADRAASSVVDEIERWVGLSYGASPKIFAETFDVLLLLGRPASGKSEFIDFMLQCPAEERARDLKIAPFHVVDDFPILWEKFEEDDLWESLGRQRLYSKRSDGNYAVTDDGLWAFLIGMINRRTVGALSRDHRCRHTLIIEFSRGGSRGYADALRGLSPEILSRAAILYVSVSFEESWRRNVARYNEKARGGILTHSVPRDEMQRTYGADDWHTLTDGALGTIPVGDVLVPYATMLNEPESTDPAELRARYQKALHPLFDLWRG